jgi:hypothetical protein
MGDPRVKQVIAKLSDSLNFANTTAVERWFQCACPDQVAQIQQFFNFEGPPVLFFFTKSREPLQMFVSSVASDYPGSSGCILVPYFLKVERDKQGVTAGNMDNTVIAGVIHGDPVESFWGLLKDSYLPAVQSSLSQTDEDIDRREIDLLLG